MYTFRAHVVYIQCPWGPALLHVCLGFQIFPGSFGECFAPLPPPCGGPHTWCEALSFFQALSESRASLTKMYPAGTFGRFSPTKNCHQKTGTAFFCLIFCEDFDSSINIARWFRFSVGSAPVFRRRVSRSPPSAIWMALHAGGVAKMVAIHFWLNISCSKS